MPLRAPSSSRADIAILTVIPAELVAALDALGISETARSKDDVGTISYRGKVRSRLTGRDYDVVLTCLGRAGNYVSAVAVQDVLSRYQPQAVLLMGIAAGLRNKVKIGEVVLAERVVAYEHAAVVHTSEGTSRQEPRPEIQVIPYPMNQDVTHYRPAPERLQQRFESYGGRFPEPVEGKELLYREHVATQVAVKTATIASGEKLLRDPSKLLEARSLHGKTEVGEMEAVGVMEACQRSGVPWLVIRGISDFGDEFKDDRFHELASRAAAAVLADFVEYGLEISGPSANSRRLRRWLALPVGALLLVGGVGYHAEVLHWDKTRPAAVCAGDYGPSPFKRTDATHFLVAGFKGSPAATQDFSGAVTSQVLHALNAYKEEALSSPQEVDLEVPEGSLEVARVNCVIETHEHAEIIARALNANVVIWGEAFFNSGDNSYTVRPKATLNRQGTSIRRGADSKIELGSLGHLDLPALRSTEPFVLVQFALGLHFYEKGNYWLAARFFEKSAVKVLPKERGAAEIRMALGKAYYYLPDLERSIHYSREALDVPGVNGSPLEGVLLNNIGSALASQGDHAEAQKYFWRALAVSEKFLGKNHPDVATNLNNIGSALMNQGNYTEALMYHQQALAISEKALGEEHPHVARYLRNIGNVFSAQGDYKEALKYHRQALAIVENVLGKDHPEVVECLNCISVVLFAQKDYSEALEHLWRALAISEKALGKDHPAVAQSLNNIGSVLYAQGNYDEALKHLWQSLEVLEKIHGKNHPDVAQRLTNIGSVLRAKGDYREALKLHQRALEISEKALGRDHPTTQVIRSNRALVSPP